jgi:hypothetical protein
MRTGRALVSLAAAGLAIAGFTPPTTASAASACHLSSAHASSSPVVVGTTDTKTKSISVRLSNCTPTKVKSYYFDWVIGTPLALAQYVPLKATYDGGDSWILKGTAKFNALGREGDYAGLSNSDAGANATYVRITKRSNGYYVGDGTSPTVKLLRATQFTSMIPGKGIYAYTGDEAHHSSTMRKGATIHVQSFLERVTWNGTPHYRGSGNQPVTLQFRTTHGSYHTIRTLKTLNAVDYPEAWVDVKATVDGCFRYLYKGNSTSGHVTTAGGCVNVK